MPMKLTIRNDDAAGPAVLVTLVTASAEQVDEAKTELAPGAELSYSLDAGQFLMIDQKEEA